jgi:hypothetical protein
MSDKNKQLFDEEQASEASQNVVNSKIIELTRDIVEVPLPSKGLVYGPSHPLHGKESTSIVELTPLEESVMYDKQKIRNGTVIDDLVQVCLYDKSLNVQTILSGDRDILFALIRALFQWETVRIMKPTLELSKVNLMEQLPLPALPTAHSINRAPYACPSNTNLKILLQPFKKALKSSLK